MNKKKIPQRMCIVCGESKDNRALYRIVKTPEGIHYDPTGRQNGRGAYLCGSPDCLRNLQKKHALDRAFSMSVEEAVYDERLKELTEKLGQNTLSDGALS